MNPICILPRRVCRLNGIKMTNMLCDNRSIRDMYSTTEYFDAVGPVNESMPPRFIERPDLMHALC